MRERPILFTAPMVRAILEGTKTQTRRVVKGLAHEWLTMPKGFNAEFVALPENHLCPYGYPGDRLWVRESCWIWGLWVKNGLTKAGRQKWRFKQVGQKVTFDAPDKLSIAQRNGLGLVGWVRRPSIHMPRWASRITLEVTGVRVERLQDISEADAQAEGIESLTYSGITTYRNYALTDEWAAVSPMLQSPIASYRSLWESINGPGSWGANPWVWVITFKRLEGGAA